MQGCFEYPIPRQLSAVPHVRADRRLRRWQGTPFHRLVIRPVPDGKMSGVDAKPIIAPMENHVVITRYSPIENAVDRPICSYRPPLVADLSGFGGVSNNASGFDDSGFRKHRGDQRAAPS